MDIYDPKLSEFNKNELLNYLKKLYDHYSANPEYFPKGQINRAKQVLIGEYGMREKEIMDFVLTKEEIIEDFSNHIYNKYENEEDLEPDY